MVVAWARGQERWSFNGYRVNSEDWLHSSENILQGTLKMVTKVNFLLRVFYHNFFCFVFCLSTEEPIVYTAPRLCDSGKGTRSPGQGVYQSQGFKAERELEFSCPSPEPPRSVQPETSYTASWKGLSSRTLA